ncbi:hypothetical protein D3C76_1112620 [compost metagenome]
MLDRGSDGRRGARFRVDIAQITVTAIQLAYLPLGPPAQVAITSVAKVGTGNPGQPPGAIETRRQFAGQRLDMHEAAVTRQLDSLLIEMLGLDQSSFHPCNFCPHQCQPAGEGCRALLRPDLQLAMMLR